MNLEVSLGKNYSAVSNMIDNKKKLLIYLSTIKKEIKSLLKYAKQHSSYRYIHNICRKFCGKPNKYASHL